MSEERTTCASCGGEFVCSVADGLHVSRRPEIREQILAGNLHRFECPTCHRITRVERRLAYTDFPRRQWFVVYPEVDLHHRGELAAFARTSFQAVMVDRAPPIVQSWAGEMKKRVIFGLASLREKLALFDAKLDDRIIEVLKLQLYQHLQLVFDRSTYFYFASLDQDTLRFGYSPPGDGDTDLLRVPIEAYQTLWAERAALSGRLPEIFGDLVVDHRALMVPDLQLAKVGC